MRAHLLLIFLCVVFGLGEARKGKGGSNRGGKNATTTPATQTIECFGEPLPEGKWNLGLGECMAEVQEALGGGDKPARARKKQLKRNQMCIKLCQRKRQGILDGDGKWSETGASKFVEDLFPQKARSRIQRGLNRCAEDYGEGFQTTNNCKEYKRFEKCFNRMVMKTCSMKNSENSGGSGGRGGKNGRKNNKGKNKGNHRRQQQHKDHHEDEEEEEEAEE